MSDLSSAGVRLPRFYFDVYDGRLGRDDEGQSLPSHNAAFAEAVRAARELAVAEEQQDGVEAEHRIEVRDESGRVFATVFFREALRIAS